jgi:serine/threonine protein kinase
VDCWSFGIIIYLMLSRHLPFDSNDDKEIGRKTIYQQIAFTHPIWENVSAEAKDLVSSKSYNFCSFFFRTFAQGQERENRDQGCA